MTTKNLTKKSTTTSKKYPSGKIFIKSQKIARGKTKAKGKDSFESYLNREFLAPTGNTYKLNAEQKAEGRTLKTIETKFAKLNKGYHFHTFWDTDFGFVVRSAYQHIDSTLGTENLDIEFRIQPDVNNEDGFYFILEVIEDWGVNEQLITLGNVKTLTAENAQKAFEKFLVRAKQIVLAHARVELNNIKKTSDSEIATNLKYLNKEIENAQKRYEKNLAKLKKSKDQLNAKFHITSLKLEFDFDISESKAVCATFVNEEKLAYQKAKIEFDRLSATLKS